MQLQLTIWSAMLFLTSNALATVLTVSADPNHPAQFSTLQAAHSAASIGDTIQWYGNNNVSSGGTSQFSKPLVIQGVHSTNNRPSINFSNEATGTRILSGSYEYLDGNQSLSYFEIRNSWVRNIVSFGGNLVCVNSIIGGFSGVTSFENFYSFQNCIFVQDPAFFPGSSQSSGLSLYVAYASVIIDHCVFLSNINLNSNFTNTTLNISNSVFVGSINPAICFNVDTAFDSNLFVDYSINDTQFCGPNIATSNIMNAPNPFINSSLSNLSALNFQLTESSEGNNAASDGGDIGLHGGSSSWPIGYHYGLNSPGVPVINSVYLDNYTIGVSEPLHFNAEGIIPSND